MIGESNLIYMQSKKSGKIKTVLNMEHLIANSGLQFICTELELNPSVSPELGNGKALNYHFMIKNERDELTDMEETKFDILCQCGNVLVPLKELLDPFMRHELEQLPTGRVNINEAGLPIVRKDANLTVCQTFPMSGSSAVFRVSTLNSFEVNVSSTTSDKVSAYELILGKWLPVPMFEKEVDGYSKRCPTGWCRVKLERLDKRKNGTEVLRAIWAFDTDLGDALEDIRPVFELNGPTAKSYALCNVMESLNDFLFVEDLLSEGLSLSSAAEYIIELIDPSGNASMLQKLKILSYYLYFVNFLRLSGAPEIELHHRPANVIDVDMVLDIGNSRTCGVLFEDGSFRKGKMLHIRDLSRPWITYDNSFDMRIAFRKADFGSEIRSSDHTLFAWSSILRVGEEARNLMYSSRENDGIEELTTNYSSPKRYLWDDKPFAGKWDFVISENDPTSVKAAGSVYANNLSVWFDRNGVYNGERHPGSDGNKYSRGSLMTFAFLEIFQQAYMYMNSIDYRNHTGKIDCRRRLRNIIITAPTAMPNSEQIALRKCAKDANEVLKRIRTYWTGAKITPDPEAINLNGAEESVNRGWQYDEATASHFVYLFAEINEKYNGEIEKFIDAKGHIRPEDDVDGNGQKSLTLASIDIGAGTTDLMICSYSLKSATSAQLSPKPLFWDSFYIAGDDIMKKVIQELVIDGDDVSTNDNVGSISSILNRKLRGMTNEQIAQMPIMNKSRAFRLLFDNVQSAIDVDDRNRHLSKLAGNIVANYFGVDASSMNYKDKICRLDFNTQISVPIAQLFLEQLRLQHPARLFSYDEIFKTNKPTAYLLRHFEEHFGFPLEDIEWRYEPDKIAVLVSKTLEPLMKQLSIILNAYGVDTLILAGRPASLEALTDLFIKFYPVSPDRLVRLNEYHVGRWYPLATDQGYFVDQKSVVAVGAMVGYMASTVGFPGLSLNMTTLAEGMHSTANYIGVYNPDNFKVNQAVLTPTAGRAQIIIDTFPAFLGCKQLNVQEYHARPLYAIYNETGKSPLKLTLVRDYRENREKIEIEEAYDRNGDAVNTQEIELNPQSLAETLSGSPSQEQTMFWMDNGAFKFLDA